MNESPKEYENLCVCCGTHTNLIGELFEVKSLGGRACGECMSEKIDALLEERHFSSHGSFVSIEDVQIIGDLHSELIQGAAGRVSQVEEANFDRARHELPGCLIPIESLAGAELVYYRKENGQ